MNSPALPVISQIKAPVLPPLTPRPSQAISNPQWLLCSELSEQYWVVLSLIYFPASRYCSAWSVYTAFIWDNFNSKEIAAIESFKYRQAIENYHERIKVAQDLFIM